MTTTTPAGQRPCPPWIDPAIWPLIPGWRQIREVQRWWADLGLSEMEEHLPAEDLWRAAVQHADRGLTAGDLAGTVGVRRESVRARLRGMPGGKDLLERLDANRRTTHRTTYRRLKAEGVQFRDIPVEVRRHMLESWRRDVA